MEVQEKNARPGLNEAATLAKVGALLAATLSSACCWLPLLLIALGISSGTLAAQFAAFRPILLPIAFALLGLAFFLTYRSRRNAAAPALGGGESCNCPPEHPKRRTLGKPNEVLLWGVTVLVLGFAFFPHYASFLPGGQGETQSPSHRELFSWKVTVQGMSCQSCAAHLQGELAKVAGIIEARVDYEQGIAEILATAEINESVLQRTVESAGFVAGSIEKATKPQRGV